MVVHAPQADAEDLKEPQREFVAVRQEFGKRLPGEGESRGFVDSSHAGCAGAAIDQLQFAKEIAGMEKGKEGFGTVTRGLRDAHPSLYDQVQFPPLGFVFEDDLPRPEAVLGELAPQRGKLLIGQDFRENIVAEPVDVSCGHHHGRGVRVTAGIYRWPEGKARRPQP